LIEALHLSQFFFLALGRSREQWTFVCKGRSRRAYVKVFLLSIPRRVFPGTNFLFSFGGFSRLIGIQRRGLLCWMFVRRPEEIILLVSSFVLRFFRSGDEIETSPTAFPPESETFGGSFLSQRRGCSAAHGRVPAVDCVGDAIILF